MNTFSLRDYTKENMDMREVLESIISNNYKLVSHYKVLLINEITYNPNHNDDHIISQLNVLNSFLPLDKIKKSNEQMIVEVMKHYSNSINNNIVQVVEEVKKLIKTNNELIEQFECSIKGYTAINAFLNNLENSKSIMHVILNNNIHDYIIPAKKLINMFEQFYY